MNPCLPSSICKDKDDLAALAVHGTPPITLLQCRLGPVEGLTPCILVFEPIEATSLKDLVGFSGFALRVQILPMVLISVISSGVLVS